MFLVDHHRIHALAITNCFPSLSIFWQKYSIFGQGFITHQQGDAILYNIRNEFDGLLKVNFTSEPLAEIQGIVWLMDLCENFARGYPEERISSTDCQV